MAFRGRDTVRADLRLHKQMAGGVTAATLLKQSGGTVALNNVCLWPDSQGSALGQGGFPARTAKLTFWRLGESDFPRADDRITVGSVTYQVASLDSKAHNADEADGYATYRYTLTKAI